MLIRPAVIIAVLALVAPAAPSLASAMGRSAAEPSNSIGAKPQRKRSIERIRMTLPTRLDIHDDREFNFGVSVPDQQLTHRSRWSMRCRSIPGGKPSTWWRSKLTRQGWQNVGQQEIRLPGASGDWRCRTYLTTNGKTRARSKSVRVVVHPDLMPTTLDISNDGTRALIRREEVPPQGAGSDAYTLEVVSVPSGRSLWATKTTGDETSYDLSPDGTKVAFWSTTSSLPAGNDNPAPDLYVQDLAGSLTRIDTGPWGTTGNGQAAGKPHFAPDSSRLIFQANDYGHYVYDTTTGTVSSVLSSYICDGGLWPGPTGATWFAQQSPWKFQLIDQATANVLRTYDVPDPGEHRSFDLVGQGVSGRYAFLSESGRGWGEEPRLDRIDLETGEFVTLLEDREAPSGMAATGDWIVTYSGDSNGLRLWDRETGLVERAVLPRWPSHFSGNWGDAELTPDGRSLIVIEQYESDPKLTIVKVDTVTGSVAVVARDVVPGNVGQLLVANNGVFFYRHWSTPVFATL